MKKLCAALVLAALLPAPLKSQDLTPVLVNSGVGTWRFAPHTDKMEAARHWLLLAMGDGLIPSAAINSAAQAVVICIDRESSRFTPREPIKTVLPYCIRVIGAVD